MPQNSLLNSVFRTQKIVLFILLSSLVFSSCKKKNILKIKKKPIVYTEISVFEKNNLFGYKTSKDSILLEAQYLVATSFSEKGIALVTDQKSMKYINWKGEILVEPFVFDNGVDYFKEGLARFVEHEKMGFFDESATKVIAAKYDFAYPFSEGLAAVCIGCEKIPSGEHSYVSNGKWGFVDKKGKLAIDLIFQEARSFVNKKAKVKQYGEWIIINKKGVAVSK